MIFKHEFIVEETSEYKELAIIKGKERCEYELGRKIGETFGFNQIKPRSPEQEQFELEIIAFRGQDWEIFRQRLNHFFPNRELDVLLNDLENAVPLDYPENIKPLK